MRPLRRLASAFLEEHLDRGRLPDTPLSRVLAAARAPATADELAGLDAARAEFLCAPHGASRVPSSGGRPTASRTAAGRLIAFKAVAGISGAMLIGGVAYAASSTSILGGSSDQPAPRHSWTSQHLTPGVPAPGAGEPSAGTGAPSVVGGRGRAERPHATATKPAAHPRTAPGSSLAAVARGTHTRPALPTSTHVTTRPTPTPVPTPTGHAKTTPAQRPSDPAGTHSVHPTPTGPPG